MLTHTAIRQSFLDFFKAKEHKILPSASLVPQGDPSILFNNAGMNPFKDIFLGIKEPEKLRVCDAQKCIRLSGKHNDLEEVGKDTYHHAFFEMLGNWSFGDYYKDKAIKWAWELLTEVWHLPKAELYATVFKDDDEAFELWPQVTDLPPERVFRFDEKDNFWEMGKMGPCGPCSEIHIDMGEENCTCLNEADRKICRVPGGGINRDCARYLEIWNLVFIQSNREEDGTLTPLKHKHIDTGMGFERITAVLQHKISNYETDLFLPLIEALERLTECRYPLRRAEIRATATLSQQNTHPTQSNTPQHTIIATATAFRVVVDHLRAISFAIADGVIPSNEGRGYVIRRLIRRAYRYGTHLGCHKPFLHQLVPNLVTLMGEHYRELQTEQAFIVQTLLNEEETFHQTLHTGEKRFNHLIELHRTQSESILSGSHIYELYDTYGFPLDLIKLMAEEVHFTLDEPGFDQAMAHQKLRSRADQVFSQSSLITLLPKLASKETQYTGDRPDGNRYETPATLLNIIVNGKLVPSLTLAELAAIEKTPPPQNTAQKLANQPKKTVHESNDPSTHREATEIFLLFDKTPFYGEAGGQIGDTGWILPLASEKTSPQPQSSQAPQSSQTPQLSQNSAHPASESSPSSESQSSTSAPLDRSQSPESLSLALSPNLQTQDSPPSPPRHCLAEITDTQHSHHLIFLRVGALHHDLKTQHRYLLRIDQARKLAIRQNHSATHLLHQALITTLGPHVKQHGSLVHHQKLRFDFNHPKPLPESTLHHLEQSVRTAIKHNLPVTVSSENKDQALASGAKAFFEEKYGQIVRVVRMGTYSSELCGGSHVHSTSEIGGFTITSATSIASGIKRIEALTGTALFERYETQNALLSELQTLLQVPQPSSILPKITALLTENQSLRDTTLQAQKTQIIKELKENTQTLTLANNKTATLYYNHFDNMHKTSLTSALDHLKHTDPESIVLITHKSLPHRPSEQPLSPKTPSKKPSSAKSSPQKLPPPENPGSNPDSKAYFWLGLGKNLAKELSAKNLLQTVIEHTQGKGGGKAEFAQGSTSRPNTLPQTLPEIVEDIKKQVTTKPH